MPLQDATIEDIDDELARRELIRFTERTKSDYKTGWFQREVAVALDQFLQDVLDKKSPRLILTAPPQHGKSELTSRRFPAFAFGRASHLRIIGTAYSADLAESFSVDVQRVIDNEVYARIFPDTRILAENAKSATNKRSVKEFTVVGKAGKYRAAGRGGPITGQPADILIVDDLIKDFEESISLTIRESAWNWLTSTAMTRLQEGGGVIVMATRWHMDDPIGRLLERQPGRWKLINFPAIAEENEPHRTIGDPLSVERFSLATLESIRDGGAMNSYQWAALYQQHPSPLGGGIFKRDDWCFYDVDAPIAFDEILESWDCTFKDSTDSDFVSGQVWGYRGAQKYLIDRINARMSFGATRTAIRTLSAKHPLAYRKFIEDKANGPAIINDLQGEISGMIAVDPQGGKIARAHAVSGEVEAHNVSLPARRDTTSGALVPLPWVNDFIEQHAAFPSGTHDDDVDACTQALAQIRKLTYTLGVVEYLKNEQRRIDNEKVQTTTLQKPAMPDNAERCPQCQSTAIVKIPGARRCNSCGHQFGSTSVGFHGVGRKDLLK